MWFEKVPLCGSDQQHPPCPGLDRERWVKIHIKQWTQGFPRSHIIDLRENQVWKYSGQDENLCEIFFIYKETTLSSTSVSCLGLYYGHLGIHKQCYHLTFQS